MNNDNNASRTEYPSDILGMDPDTMRELGYRVVDLVVQRLQNRDSEAVIRCADRDSLQARIGGPLPQEAIDPKQSLTLLAEYILDHQQHGDHPRYFARVPGPAAYAAMLGDWLATGFNTIATSWGGSAGPSTVELVVIDWLAELLGMPSESEGVLLSGGSMANTTAFSVARAERGQGVVYLSDQAHSSLPRSLRELGFSDEQLCFLQSDDDLKLSLPSLKEAIDHDRAAGRKPMMVIASAGTTNAGTVDPLNGIASLCETYGLWMHVDGAYGAPAALTEQGRVYLDGMARADSLVLDPHKWFFQPYDAGCLLVRHPGALQRCFDMNPEYLRDVQASDGEVDLRNRSLELTRKARAIKLWMSLRSYGVPAFRDAIQRGIALAEVAERHLRSQPERWVVVTPAQIGVICFELKGGDRALHEHCARVITESGFAAVSSSSLKGRSVLRLCTINPLTTDWDIRETIDRLAKAAD